MASSWDSEAFVNPWDNGWCGAEGLIGPASPGYCIGGSGAGGTQPDVPGFIYRTRGGGDGARSAQTVTGLVKGLSIGVGFSSGAYSRSHNNDLRGLCEDVHENRVRSRSICCSFPLPVLLTLLVPCSPALSLSSLGSRSDRPPAPPPPPAVYSALKTPTFGSSSRHQAAPADGASSRRPNRTRSSRLCGPGQHSTQPRSRVSYPPPTGFRDERLLPPPPPSSMSPPLPPPTTPSRLVQRRRLKLLRSLQRRRRQRHPLSTTRRQSHPQSGLSDPQRDRRGRRRPPSRRRRSRRPPAGALSLTPCCRLPGTRPTRRVTRPAPAPAPLRPMAKVSGTPRGAARSLAALGG